MALLNFTALPPLSLYIHMPWCIKKCPYCDFNSHTAADNLPEEAYINALIADVEQALPSIWGRRIQSIFIGGGTPSLFSADAYATLFSRLRSLLSISPHAEITLEANPGTVEQQRFADYRAIGINRLSIGIQSFDDNALKALGRIHDSQQAIRAVQCAHQAGYDNVNLDLMFGLPGQTAELAARDISIALDLAPTHLSYYQLTIEPNTAYAHQPPKLPADDSSYDWQLANQERLATAGYQQYEISAYSQTDRQCQHNLNYWQFGDYLGIGAGAHSKITDASQQSITRSMKQKQPQAYLTHQGTPQQIQTVQTLTSSELGFEFMLNALRLTNGFASALFLAHTGLPLSTIEKPLLSAERQGLLNWDIQHIQPTAEGQRYLNDVISLFLQE